MSPVDKIMNESEKILEQFRKRYEKEYDTYLNVGVKINDSLLLINSAIIAVLIASDRAGEIKYIVFLLFISTIFSLLSLFYQKELSRESAVTFLKAHIEGQEAEQQGRMPNLPELNLRKKSDMVSYLINLSLLAFFAAVLLALLSVFCGK